MAVTIVPETAPRRRVDRTAGAAARPATSGRSEARASTLRVIDDPCPYIFVVVGDVSVLDEHIRDVFGAARLIADRQAAAVVSVGGPDRHILKAVGADRWISWPDKLSPGDHPGPTTGWLQEVAREFLPVNILFPEQLDLGDIARRLAAKVKEIAATQVIRIDGDNVVRRGGDRRFDWVGSPAYIMTLCPEVALPISDLTFEARPLPAQASINDFAGDDYRTFPVAVTTSSLTINEAALTIGAGAGVVDWPRLERVASLLGAAIGGTRVVCDAGRLPRDRQIGVSGTPIDADCYIAAGVSGAIQHLQGIESCRHVVAINTDPHAPIFKRADLAIQGDINAILAALEQRLESSSR